MGIFMWYLAVCMKPSRHSSKLCSLEELENLLRTSNSRMTFQKEFLTDKVYYYCREKDKFIMLQGSLKMLVTTIRMDEEN